jgi:hypothetical protein
VNERRIDTVLRVRALRERIARAEVARRRTTLEQRRAEEEAAWAAVRARSSTGALGADRFVAHRVMLGAGVLEASTAGERVATADGEVATAMSTWQDEARRLDGIERLAERIRTESRAEVQRLEYRELDDVVVMRSGHADEADR